MSDIQYSSTALKNCIRKYDCSFSPNLFSIKRNLLFVSMLSIAALFITPKEGIYSINLGIINGEITQPIIIYIGLILACVYQLYYFWINCRQTIFNYNNFSKVEEFYMNELAAIYAYNEWNKLAQRYAKGVNMAIGSFNRSPSSGNNGVDGKWMARGEMQFDHLNSQSEFIKALTESNNFIINESRGFSLIDYVYTAKAVDYTFLSMHKDVFWLSKKKEFIEYVLPVILGYIALVALFNKVAELIVN